MSSDRAIACLLLDLDGVIRHFDSAHVAAVEARHGLAAGSIFHAAFEPVLLEQVTTGRITLDGWVDAVGVKLGSPAAALDWKTDPGTVDWDVIALVDELRAAGTTVAILTNGTDAVPQELVDLGVRDHFDRLFNSAEIGITKPDPRVFEHVCEALGLSPGQIFFTDDSKSKLAGAIEIGMCVEQFTDAATLKSQLRELGLLD